MTLHSEGVGALRFTRSWLPWMLLVLVPLWALGLFGRGPWKPDEPREYDIALNMLQGHDWVVPTLAGEPFLEKPPLTYWSAALSMRIFGTSIDAARIPNLLWAAISAVSMGLLARAFTRRNQTAALVAALIAGSTFLVFRVQIWLTTDAPLLAFTAIALLTGWYAANAVNARAKWLWYSAWGVALGCAFLSKSIFGLLVPLSALGGLLLWKGRWKDLLSAPLLTGCVVAIAVVTPWLWALGHTTDGAAHLRELLWENIVGRFVPGNTQLVQTLGHRNTPLKYLLSLPYFLLPWTCVAVAAARWAVLNIRKHGEFSDAARFCICAIVPAVVLINVSATARDVYFGPSLLAFGPLVGMWYSKRFGAFDKFERICLKVTRYLVVLVAAIAVLGTIGVFASQPAPRVNAWMVIALCLGGIAAVAAWLLRKRSDLRPLLAQLPAYCVGTALLMGFGFPALDATQDLTPVATLLEPVSGTRPVALFCGDETIRAALDYGAGVRLERVDDGLIVQRMLLANPSQIFLARVGDEPMATRTSRLSGLVPGLWKTASKNTREARALRNLGLVPLAQWSTPGGRGYALFGFPAEARLRNDGAKLYEPPAEPFGSR